MKMVGSVLMFLDLRLDQLLPDPGGMLQSSVQKGLVRIFMHPRNFNDGGQFGLVVIERFESGFAIHDSGAILNLH